MDFLSIRNIHQVLQQYVVSNACRKSICYYLNFLVFLWNLLLRFLLLLLEVCKYASVRLIILMIFEICLNIHNITCIISMNVLNYWLLDALGGSTITKCDWGLLLPENVPDCLLPLQTMCPKGTVRLGG